jgi:radical SAM protein with 4Fe4S-binding SPASM domain
MNMRLMKSMLRPLTFLKVGNLFRLVSSYYVSLWLKKNKHSGLPYSIAIEPTTSCNLRCPECPSGLRSFTRPTGMMDMTLYRKVIQEMHQHIMHLTIYFQGEPYLHKQFLEMVRYAHQKKIYTSTSTNAHYLDEEHAKQTVLSGLDKLIISIDGTSQETYEAYRVGGDLEKVIQGTKNIMKWKKALKSATPQVVLQFLVVGPNEHEIPAIQQLAKDLEVDELKLKTAQIYDYEHGSPFMPKNEVYSRYQKNEKGSYELKSKGDKSCWKMWHSCVITWDGKVVPCCFDKDAQHSMGNLKEQRFIEVWRSAKYEQFRTNLIQSRGAYEMCKNCTEGVKVFS